MQTGLDFQLEFLKTAVDLGFIDQTTARACLGTHIGIPPHHPVLQICLWEKHLDRNELRTVLDSLHKRLKEQDPAYRDSLADFTFALVGYRLGALKPGEFEGALERKAELSGLGSAQSLGEVLRSLNYLDADEEKAISDEIAHRVLVCQFCLTPVSLWELGSADDDTAACPVCGDPLADEPAPVLEDTGEFVEENFTSGTVLIEKEASLLGDPDQLAGRKLGHFVLKKALGTGAMGAVYLAENPILRREVALKILPPGPDPDSQLLRRFAREARLSAKLHHPNIATVFNVGILDGYPFIEMEFVQGQGLDQHIARSREGIPEKEGLGILRQIAEALKEAHSKDVIHRDIKPANILITIDGVAKLTDFGLARAKETEDHEKTEAGKIFGTPLYMSPEQCRGGAIDHLTDIYSLGISAYHMLAGQPPYKASNVVGIVDKHLYEDPRPLDEVAPVSKATANLIRKMIAKKPEKRIRSAEAIIDEIDWILHGKAVIWKRLKEVNWKRVAAGFLLMVAGMVGYRIFSAWTGQQIEEQVRSHMRAARKAIDDQRLEDAFRSVQAVLDLEPGHKGALDLHPIIQADVRLFGHRDQGRQAAKELRWDDAIAHAEAAHALRPTAWTANELRSYRLERHRTLGMRAREAGQYEEAIEHLRESLLQVPDSAEELKLELTTALTQSQRLKSARDRFEAFVTAGSEALARSEIENGLGFFDQAEALFVEYPELRAHLPGAEGEFGVHRARAYRLLGNRQRAAGAYDEAVTWFEKSLAGTVHPTVSEEIRTALTETLVDQGDLLARSSRYEEAQQKFVRALGLIPESFEARQPIVARITRTEADHFAYSLARARRLLREKKLDEARDACQIALRYRPEDLEVQAVRLTIQAMQNPHEGMIAVPGGWVALGSEESDDRNPVHRVFLKPFFISRTEVTNREFAEFVAAGGYGNRAHWDPRGWALVGTFTDTGKAPGPAVWRNGSFLEGTADHPVQGISWHEARAYARFRGLRLPTADEWEAAAGWDVARNHSTLYPWGNEWAPTAGRATGARLTAVGTTAKDRSPAGCHDMAGNVQEWTLTDLAADRAVLKGGSIIDIGGALARIPRRHSPLQGWRSVGVGFRLARDISLE